MASLVAKLDLLEQQLFFQPCVLNNKRVYEVSSVLWDIP